MESHETKYISMLFSQYPPNEPHLDSKITGTVENSLIHYSPVFVKRISDFANFKIGAHNTDAAIEKFS